MVCNKQSQYISHFMSRCTRLETNFIISLSFLVIPSLLPPLLWKMANIRVCFIFCKILFQTKYYKMLILQRCWVTIFWQNLPLVKFLDNHFGVGGRGAHLIGGWPIKCPVLQSPVSIPNTISEVISSLYEPLLSTLFVTKGISSNKYNTEDSTPSVLKLYNSVF